MDTDRKDEVVLVDDDIVRKFVFATGFWAFATTALGLYVASVMIAPHLVEGTPEATFGRTRPMHTNIAVYGLVANGVFAAIYYSLQRLCRRGMFSRGLSRAHFWTWQILVAIGVGSLPFGFTQGKEYAEWEWPIDLAWLFSFVVFFAANVTLTVWYRRRPETYVSIWFYVASILVVAVSYAAGSFAMPIDAMTSRPLMSGASDALVTWVSGHNLVRFLMSVPLVGAAYYFLPKASGIPIRNYGLAVLHFWSLVILSLWAGPFHLHGTAVPDWVTSMGMIFGIALWMPSWGLLVNLLGCLRHRDKKKPVDPSFVFLSTSILFYTLVTLLGVLQSVKSFQAWTHYSDFVIAYVHTATMGWCAMFLLGLIYFLVPRLFQAPLASKGAVRLHFFLALAGTLLFVIPLYMAGFKESAAWFSLSDKGNLNLPETTVTIDAAKSYWHFRVLGGLVYFIGLVVMAINVLRTWASRPSVYQSIYLTSNAGDSNKASSSETSSTETGTTAPGPLDDAPVLETARKLSQMGDFAWHQRFDQSNGMIVRVVAVVIGLAILVELVPTILVSQSAAKEKIAKQSDYTPLELLGRDIYLREGCVQCHSQNVRPLVAETIRYGEPSVGMDSATDRPFLWGSRRIGPDLARVGGRRSSLWHWNHLIDPRATEEKSIMPKFDHLAYQPMNYERLEILVRNQRSWYESLGDLPAAEMAAAEVPIESAEPASEAVTPDAEGNADGQDPKTMSEPAPSSVASLDPDQWRESVRAQAERVAADVVSQGGPLFVDGRLSAETNLISLIAYLQKLGVANVAPAR